MKINLDVETTISRSMRARQVEALFDVPAQEKSKLNWTGNVPIEERPWNVGLIVGPSGCGKSTVAKHLFGDHFHPELQWGAPSVLDDFKPDLSVADIGAACSSVGFNTVPAWLRPHAVLSNGEKFRVELARRMLELEDPIVVDEFTSVVDRQVAQVGSHAVAKFVRKHGRRFVAVSCHHDIVDWLQPDWVLEPATMTFTWRSLQRRPSLEVEVAEVEYETWRLFAPYHYLSADLNKACRSFALLVNGQPVAFAGILSFPHPKVKDIRRCSRLVTLPDWQGLGLAFVLIDHLSAAYKRQGFRMRTYPAHPMLVRSFAKQKSWSARKEPGVFSAILGKTTTIGEGLKQGAFGGRPCAVFEYVGPAASEEDTISLLGKHIPGRV